MAADVWKQQSAIGGGSRLPEDLTGLERILRWSRSLVCNDAMHKWLAKRGLHLCHRLTVYSQQS